MKYGIDIGHNAPPDTGASGILQEDNLTRDVGLRVISKLRALGHSVVNCTPQRASSVTNSLWQRTNRANVNRVDVYVSIHFNAFNRSANGTEVFAISNTGRRLAGDVVDEIASLGFFNRGVKNGAHMYVLRHTIAPAILVECCFCDSRVDMDRYEPEKMATAIVTGLTGQAPKPTPQPEPTQSEEVRQLQRVLNRLRVTGSDGRRLTEDGLFGAMTKSATQRLQAILGLVSDGIAGDRTWRAIRQVLAKPILRPNQTSGPAVRYVQYRMGADIDGIFGPQTAAAVRRYQSRNGLTVDGIVGPQSWGKLIG
ncbi:MAG: N-acetylmuramoyl-L-alanine amidase [Cyanobacteria bacterium P01_H01_bin.130]